MRHLTRRELVRAAAAGGGLLAAGGAMADQSPSPAPAASPPAAEPNATTEGAALAAAALAAAGFPLPADQASEVRKQLANYPAGFSRARRLALENGAAPAGGVTPALPRHRRPMR